MAAMTIYFSWRLFFTLPFRFGPLASAVGIILLITELTGAVETFELYRNYSRSALPELPVISAADYPEVDVFIATHNESAELLYKTINACKYMVYPDKNRVHIYLCDDSDRPEIAALAEQMDIGYFGLRENRHAKAGNLNNAIFKTHSPLIATFDADMIPTHDFLMRTVPYFFLDNGPTSALSSHPRAFITPTFSSTTCILEEKLPKQQDYFFKEVNVNRNYANAPIYAGSNTLISRRAVTEVGGIATDSITEDFATGIRIQAAGYRCYAIPTVLAHGLAPATLRYLSASADGGEEGVSRPSDSSTGSGIWGCLSEHASAITAPFYTGGLFSDVLSIFLPRSFSPFFRSLSWTVPCLSFSDLFNTRLSALRPVPAFSFREHAAAQGGAILSTPLCFPIPDVSHYPGNPGHTGKEILCHS